MGDEPIEMGAVVALSPCTLALSFLLGLAFKVAAEQKRRARPNKRTKEGGAHVPFASARLRCGTARSVSLLCWVLAVGGAAASTSSNSTFTTKASLKAAINELMLCLTRDSVECAAHRPYSGMRLDPASCHLCTAKYGPISSWNVSAITDMSNLFAIGINDRVMIGEYLYDFVAFGPDNGNISGWNTSGVTDMSNMFLVRSCPCPPVPTVVGPSLHRRCTLARAAVAPRPLVLPARMPPQARPVLS